MWNQIRTDTYEGMLAETATIQGSDGDTIRAYVSRPLGEGPYPGVVVIPHKPGWDELNREVTRRLSQHGFAAICPNIYERFGHGLPTEVAAMVQEAGGVSDDSVVGDVEGAIDFISTQPYSNGKTGVIGMCSGGRHAFLAACRIDRLDAAVECWGGRVVQSEEELSPITPVAPIDLTSQLNCPLLGIFGNDDKAPSKEQVDLHEEELKKHGKDYRFLRYDGAGHAIWNYSSEAYRPTQAIDSWNKALAFFSEHLKGE